MHSEDVTFSLFKRTSPWNQKSVLKELSCLILSGRVLGILGPNGSGKSTLLKLLARVSFGPQKGTIEIFGESLSEPISVKTWRSEWRSCRKKHFRYFLLPLRKWCSWAGRLIIKGWGGWHWEDSQDWAVAQNAMEELDVAHLGNRLVTEVSGGERQRAVIARALVQEPQISCCWMNRQHF